jgi:hypothetical protein
VIDGVRIVDGIPVRLWADWPLGDKVAGFVLVAVWAFILSMLAVIWLYGV